MATIPLSAIPNAPDLASMSRPLTNGVNAPMVDFGSQKAAIASGYNSISRSYESNKTDPNNAAKIGAAVSEVGQGAYKVANQYQEQQQKLNDTAAIAEFSTAYAVGQSELKDSLDKSSPETWAGQYGEWYQKKMMPMYEAMPTSAKQKFYPDLLKTMYEGQASFGHEAHLQSVKNSMEKGLANADLAIQQNNFPAARKTYTDLRSANAISEVDLASKLAAIDSAEQIHTVDVQISTQPFEMEAKIQKAIIEDAQLPEFPRISKDQLPQLAKRARDIGGMQQQILVSEIGGDIGGTIKTPDDVANDPRIKNVRDQKDIEALKQRVINSRVTDATTQSADMNIMSRLHAFPLDKNNALMEAADLQRDINNYASGPMADHLSKTLEGIKGEMASNGGERKSESKMGQYLGQRLEQVKLGNLYGKFHTDAEVRKDTTGKMAKENTDVLKRIEAVREAVMQKAPKNSIEADNAIQEVLSIEISKKNAGEIGNKKGWFDFFNSTPKPNALLESRPQASTSSVPDSTVAFVKEKEGFTPNRYTDSDKDIGSIGYGTYAKEGETTITEQGATERLKEELSGHQDTITKAASSVGLKLSEKQQTALTSFSFNVGAETAAKVIRQSGGNMDALKSKMAEYRSATIKGVKKPILQKRRDSEIQLMASQQYTEDGRG